MKYAHVIMCRSRIFNYTLVGLISEIYFNCKLKFFKCQVYVYCTIESHIILKIPEGVFQR